jgi:hypothetical protein
VHHHAARIQGQPALDLALDGEPPGFGRGLRGADLVQPGEGAEEQFRGAIVGYGGLDLAGEDAQVMPEVAAVDPGRSPTAEVLPRVNSPPRRS